MGRAFFIASSAFLLLLTGCRNADTSSAFESERTMFVMDTAVTIKGSKNDTEKAADVLKRLDGLFDRYNDTSDISAINSRKGTPLSDETADLIRQSAELSEKYGNEVSIFAGDITDCWNIGSENPKVPSHTEIDSALESIANADFSLDTMSFSDENGSIDVGSVAKGYALDRIKSELDGDSCCIVSMTSSVLMSGSKPDGEKFTAAVRDPENGSKIIGTIRTDECFLSTSGGYERYFEADGKRYSHIFDLETGKPSDTDLTSVTVICQIGIESDFLSTLIYAGGTENLGEHLKNDDIAVLAVTDKHEIYHSDGMDFVPEKDSGYAVKEWIDE
ncbi:MAG: FAD:protein FMN transferase [Ruminococcus sp.]|nr:FAD:protein FMN transferase [Ruminococcus sp.]